VLVSSTDRGPVRVTFNPGPSQVSAEVLADIHEIAESGLLSESHRSARVKGVVSDAVTALEKALRVPDDYTLLFQPSATAAMDLVVRNLVANRTLHFVNGAFAERFAGTAGLLGADPLLVSGDWTSAPAWEAASVPDDVDLVAVTHNETSTGAAWPRAALAAWRAAHPRPLFAVDVTSSFGALAMDWSVADAWFGSVQKCLGLPAGLGFALIGPRVLDRCREIGSRSEVAPWQDMIRMADKIVTGETVETPNVLAIALLGRQMARWDLDAVEAATLAKARLVADCALPWTPYVEDAAWRSPTVHCMAVTDPAAWHARALEAGFRLGGGYGELKERCIRIATFPAHSLTDVQDLLTALAR
jgi:phosphoserine aminotransferase